MLKLTRVAMITLTGALGLTLALIGTTGPLATDASAAEDRLSINKAYTLAGVVADRSRREADI